MNVTVFFISLTCIAFILNIWWSPDLIAQEPAEKVVPAEEILKMIEKGKPVHVSDVVITGKLNLGRIKLPHKVIGRYALRWVSSPISIRNSTIQEDVDFKWSYFEKDVNFTCTQFNKSVTFGESRDTSGNPGCVFADTVCFDGTRFLQDVDFAWTTFEKGVLFTAAPYPNPQFMGETRFVGNQFSDIAVFRYVDFYGSTSFANSEFADDVHFESCKFSKLVDFSGAQFNKKIYMRTLNFQKMTLNWSQLEGKLDCDGTSYINLAKSFRNAEKYDDADAVYYEYRVKRRKLTKRLHDPTRLLEFVFLDLSCGYGVKPFRALLFGVTIILIFSGFYCRTGAIRNREDPSLKPKFMDAVYFSANTFTTVGYGDWYPTEEFLMRVWRLKVCRFRSLAMMEGLLGWLILALFLITLGKVWIR